MCAPCSGSLRKTSLSVVAVVQNRKVMYKREQTGKMKMSRAEGKELVPRNISFVVGKYFEFGPSDAKRDTLHFF